MSTVAPVQPTQNNGELFHILSPEDLLRQRLQAERQRLKKEAGIAQKEVHHFHRPIERAFRFLKSTSVNCGAPEVGAGVTEADNAGLVLSGNAAGRTPAAAGEEPGGDSSWAKEIEVSSRLDTTASRVLINWRRNHGDLRSHSKQIAVVARRQSRVLSILV